MEEDEADLRIVVCLRGRLLAERAASKAAKQDEHLMDSKLKELEAQLRSETKARKRFEKKLNFLKKKLQSLKIPHMLEDSEESRSSSLDNNSDSSCISSIASTEEPEQQAKSTSNISSDQTTEIPSDEFHTLPQCPTQETPKIDQESATSDTDSPRPKLDLEDNNGDTNKSQENNHEVDYSMALVPLSFPEEESEDSAEKEVVKITCENVRDVLGTLKNIREEIQRTMQRRQATRQMIQVG